MKKVEIHFENNADKDFDKECIEKGYRRDIWVIIDDTYYKLSAITLTNYISDCEITYREYGSYNTPFCTFFVKELRSKIIVKTIKNLFLFGYFNNTKSHPKNEYIAKLTHETLIDKFEFS